MCVRVRVSGSQSNTILQTSHIPEPRHNRGGGEKRENSRMLKQDRQLSSPPIQVNQVVKKANGMLAFMARGFEYRSRDVFMQLYRALVRSHLEYCVQFWCPYLRKDVLVIEGVTAKVY